jgi:hypothetical protein
VPDAAQNANVIISGAKRQLLSFKRSVERALEGEFSLELRERPPNARAGLGQVEIWQLVISAAVGGVAKSAADALLAMLKEAQAKGRLSWRRKPVRKRSGAVGKTAKMARKARKST